MGAISVIVLFFTVLVVLDQAKRRSEPDQGQETESSGQERGADGVQGKGSRIPTPISDRTIKLALSLPETDANTTVRLLPSADQLVEGDAYTLYEKACNALPSVLDEAILSEWGRMKPEALPLDEVKSLLDECQDAFALVDQAIVCKTCQWPDAAIGSPPSDLKVYRVFARLMGLKAAYEIANNNPLGSIQALRMGFGMARHVAQGPTLNHGMVGIGVGTLTCRQIPGFAERSHGISLYTALKSLPTPLISLEKAIQSELDSLHKDPKVNFLNRNAFLSNLEPVHERVRFLAKRFDRDIKALQCLEAIRLHGAAHNGDLPRTLNQIIQWKVPHDPVNEQPFVYGFSGDTAILESPAPQDDPRSRLQYEISLRQMP